MKIFASVGVVLFLAAALPAVGGTQPREPIALDIPSQPLGDALSAFAQQSRLQILFQASVGTKITAPAVVGMLTPEGALDRLLADTTLEYEFVDERTVAIRERVEVKSKPAAERQQASDIRMAQADEPKDTAPTAQLAQEPQLEEVMVTAQKRVQRRIDVPLSVAALSGESLERAGIDTVLDLSHAVPGLVVGDAGGGLLRYYIRGIGNVYGTSSTTLVGVYLDEADVTSSSTTQLDLRTQDIERVEVLKGPQGTLYGAGSSGGTVRYITRDPQLDRFTASGDVNLYATRHGDASRTASAVLNLPVVDDVFGLRIVGNFSDLGGWVDQPAAGRKDVNDQNLREIRVKALWKPLENLTLKAMTYLHRNDGDGIASGTDGRYVLVTAVDPARALEFSNDFDIFNLTASYDFPSLTLLSSSTYVKNSALPTLSQKYATSPPPDPLFEVLAQYRALDTDVFTQELRLSSRGGGRLNWTAGAFYKHVSYANDFTIDLAQGGVFLGSIPISSEERSKSGSLFGDVSYAVTDRAEIGAGIRYFKDDLESFDGAEAREGHFHSVDPRVYFSYGIRPDVRLYASVADGFRSGGFNVENGELSTFDPEKVRSYELGLKAALPERQLNFEAALFYSRYQDIQFFRLSANNIGSVDNGGDARVRGIDAGLEWQATAHWLFELSGNLTDTDIVKLLPGVLAVVKGDPVDFSTDYSASVSTTFSFDWAAGMPGFVRFDYSRLGPSHITDRSIPQPILYRSAVNDFLNARIGMARGHWSLELYGQNLTNENRLQDPNGGYGFGARPRPRTIGIQVGARFD